MGVVTAEGFQYATNGKTLYGLKSGTGTISSSDTTVTGSVTSFTTELAVGDIIIVNNQVRKVTAIASDTSLNIESAFDTAASSDSFEYLDQDGGTTSIPILSTSPKGTTDLFGNTIQEPWNDGKFNLKGYTHGGGELNSALGNTRTFAFAVRVADASSNQTIFNLGTPTDITITSSAIACDAFSSIVVDGSGNSITDNTWHYVELQNATDVNINETAEIINANFSGDVIPLIAYDREITDKESKKVRDYMSSLANNINGRINGIGSMIIGTTFIIQ